MWRAASDLSSSVIGGKVSGSTSSLPPARATSRWLVCASASYGGSVITTSTEPSDSEASPAMQSPPCRDQGCFPALAVDGPRCLADLDIRIEKAELAPTL